MNFCSGIFRSFYICQTCAHYEQIPTSFWGLQREKLKNAVDHSDSSLSLHFFYSYVSLFTGWDEGVLGMQLGEVARLTVNAFSFLLILSWSQINHGVNYVCVIHVMKFRLPLSYGFIVRKLRVNWKIRRLISPSYFTLLSFDLFSLHWNVSILLADWLIGRHYDVFYNWHSKVDWWFQITPPNCRFSISASYYCPFHGHISIFLMGLAAKFIMEWRWYNNCILPKSINLTIIVYIYEKSF